MVACLIGQAETWENYSRVWLGGSGNMNLWWESRTFPLSLRPESALVVLPQGFFYPSRCTMKTRKRGLEVNLQSRATDLLAEHLGTILICDTWQQEVTNDRIH